MKPPRTGDVVEVEWRDSEHIDLGWTSAKKYCRAAKKPQSYRTAGYWIAGGDQVLIVLSVDPANQHVSHAMSIPAVAIKRTVVLGRANARVRKALG